MWKIFQLLVVFAVVGTNIEWQWTDNPLAATVVGILVAFVATDLLTALADLLRNWNAAARRLIRRKHLDQEAGAVVTPRSKLLNAPNTVRRHEKIGKPF